jgi:hypothetical protein
VIRLMPNRCKLLSFHSSYKYVFWAMSATSARSTKMGRHRGHPFKIFVQWLRAIISTANISFQCMTSTSSLTTCHSPPRHRCSCMSVRRLMTYHVQYRHAQQGLGCYNHQNTRPAREMVLNRGRFFRLDSWSTALAYARMNTSIYSSSDGLVSFSGIAVLTTFALKVVLPANAPRARVLHDTPP